MDFYEILSEVLIKILSFSLLLPKEFCYQFNDLILAKILGNSENGIFGTSCEILFLMYLSFIDDTMCLVWLEIFFKLIDILPENYVISSVSFYFFKFLINIFNSCFIWFRYLILLLTKGFHHITENVNLYVWS